MPEFCRNTTRNVPESRMLSGQGQVVLADLILNDGIPQRCVGRAGNGIQLSLSQGNLAEMLACSWDVVPDVGSVTRPSRGGSAAVGHTHVTEEDT